MIEQWDANKLVSHYWPVLEWRHHGVGLLQAYLPDDPTRRVHIWHRSLLQRGIEDSGAKHNHRFALESVVVLGSLLNTCFHVEPYRRGSHQLWNIVRSHDRSRSVLEPKHRVQVEVFSEDRLRQGKTYSVPKGHYHWARQPEDFAGVTVTLVTLTDKSGTATILAPYGHPPRHAFDDTERADTATVNAVVNLARARLDEYNGEWGAID